MTPEDIGIVLMPGIDGTGIFFEPLIRALPPNIPVSVITYPPNAMLSLEGHARFVMEHLPAKSVIAVAESFSGLVGLELLHSRPREVRGIVFSAAFARPLHRKLVHGLSLVPGIASTIPKIPVSVIGRILFGPYFDKELASMLNRGIPQIDVRGLKHRADIIVDGYPLLDERFDIPCLYLQATRDRVVPHSAMSWFAAHFDHFECARVDAPHCLLQTRPVECSARIVDFIETLRVVRCK